MLALNEHSSVNESWVQPDHLDSAILGVGGRQDQRSHTIRCIGMSINGQWPSVCITTVKMQTLCSRFHAVISGTSGDISMGSSGECLESKN